MKFNMTNYKQWVKSLMMNLTIMKLNLALKNLNGNLKIDYLNDKTIIMKNYVKNRKKNCKK